MEEKIIYGRPRLRQRPFFIDTAAGVIYNAARNKACTLHREETRLGGFHNEKS
ncbi:MAG: hypothetical protein IJP68_04905 [Selenomonadaceae bacterium]|nr:hypothetical protein [Selenomonadaceae bacterium]